jgi:O-antigen/teichoic acid export membrane protein
MDFNLEKIKNKIMNLKGLSQIAVANGLAAVIMGLFWFFMASLLETENYGELSYLLAIATIVSSASVLGAGTTIIVYTAKKIEIQSTLYLISLITSGIASVAVFFILYDFGVSLYIVGSAMFGLAISEMLGKKYYKKYALYFIAQRILVVVFAFGLYFVIGPEGVLLGFALAYLPYAIRIYKGFRDIKIDFSLIKPRFGFMINNYLTDTSRTLSFSVDKLLIGPLFGFALLGNYHLGIQVLTLLGIIPAIVFQYVLPRDSSGQSNIKLKKYTILISVFLGIIPVIAAPIFIPILFPKYVEAVIIMQIVGVAIIPRTISAMYTSELLGNEKSKIVLFGSGIYILVQISLIYFLGERFSIIGISIALVIAQIMEALFLIMMKNRDKHKMVDNSGMV